MRRPLLTLFLVLLALVALPASAPAQSSAPTREVLYQDGHGGRLLLGGTWLFRADPQDQGLAERLERMRSTAGWTPVSVPNAWNATDVSDDSQRGSVGWYRRDFRVPRARRGVQWRLRFESVNHRATVFLNGRRIGRHTGGYVPFEVPAERLSRGVNRLVVRVDNRRGPFDVPPGTTQENGRPAGGWWNYGGILREVYLRPVDGVDIAELLARPELKCRRCAASVLVRATLRNPGSRLREVQMRASVGSHRVRFPEVRVPARGTREVSARVRIENPELWSPDSPELYDVEASAVIDRRTVSRYSTHIGIRSFKVDREGRMLLNGRPITLRGASVHEEDPEVGAALSPAIRRGMISELRELNANLTRAHYPLHPHFLEMADRAGILVWDQIPFYRVPRDSLARASVRKGGLEYLDAMIRRDQNHASVFAWSIANELNSRPNDDQETYIQDSLKLIRELDPTRFSAIDFAGYPNVPEIPIYQEFDALGVNTYFGWYVGPDGALVELEQLEPYLEQLHRYYPRKALFVKEFGAEANRSGPADEKGTYQYQSNLIDYHLDVYDRKPYINGAIIWLLRDFKVRPDWDGGNPKPESPWNQKGLIDRLGKRKPAFFEAQRRFADVEARRVSAAGR